MGKREEKSRLFRDKIIKAAKIVFQQSGFENTTIDMIATKAEVGMGTAYNYFQSKEELFILAISDEVIKGAALSIPEITSSNQITDAVMDILGQYMQMMNWERKDLWLTALPIMLKSTKSNGISFLQAFESDYKLKSVITELLENCVERKMLAGDFDTASASELIMGSLFIHITSYIYTEEMPIDQVLSGIENNIKFIIKER
ncbi:MAG: TetR/AcrR family transcriptional regulator [Spirochaetales bacterium]|nr:TetR/AcrR family transcriptional regulator [Spirochaetales bacterium]